MTPERIFMRVLLPAPFSPTTACSSPSAMSKETSSRATTPGKRLVTCSMAMSGGMGVTLFRGRRFTAERAATTASPLAPPPAVEQFHQDQQGPRSAAGDPPRRERAERRRADDHRQGAGQDGQVHHRHPPQGAGEEL